MSIRLFLALVTGAIFTFALDLGLSVHHLNAAKASTSHALQIHASAACPAAAATWRQAGGRLAE